MSEGFNTQNIRNAGKAMEAAAKNYIRSYENLEETVNSTAITGSVKEALKKKLEDQKPQFEAVKKAIIEGADYMARKVVEGDRLIEDLEDDMKI